VLQLVKTTLGVSKLPSQFAYLAFTRRQPPRRFGNAIVRPAILGVQRGRLG
jgi:hypothetical protein